MKSVVVRAPQELSLEEREIPTPGPGEVRIKVHACGVCYSDHLVTDALWPDIQLPKVPGHEVAGVVDALGEGVERYAEGDRVGLGWHGGQDGDCDACLRGMPIHCESAGITGITMDGGYQEYLVAPASALARMPEGMGFQDAAPLLCAGVTTFNALRNAGARPGDLVGIQGLGGLGHLGVQFARAMGFETVAISRGSDKEEFARKLGAHHYVDAAGQDLAEAMGRLGGARVILATAPNAEAISGLVPGLGLAGCLIVVGAPFEPLQIGALDLITGTRSIKGWPSGIGIDSTDTMAFAKLHGVKAMIETFPLEDAPRAFEAMMAGTVRFRAVLDMG